MLKLALPGGDLRPAMAAALDAAGLHSEGYSSGSRSLRVEIDGRTDAVARVFRDKDIPVQVATGAYHLAVCSLPWVEEFLARHPDEGLVKLGPVGFGVTRLVLAAPPAVVERLGPLAEWPRWSGIRIATEFPHLAGKLAIRLRLPRARVLGLWGAAEAYPPEDAEACLIAADDEALRRHELISLATVAEGPAWLIGSRAALGSRDLSPLLGPLLALQPFAGLPPAPAPPRARRYATAEPPPRNGPGTHGSGRAAGVRLAVPDGHAQSHTFRALQDAGIAFEGYAEKVSVRRPVSGIDGLDVKVIRPQDMPAQVALGNFDLAVTGRDWLLDHQYAFPSTPVREVADLHRSRYTLVAVVSEDIPARTVEEALRYWHGQGRTTVRVASEYPHLADHYARNARLGRYAVLPLAGASEGFVPEDGEILIEGTETGRSLVANRLRVLEEISISTNCLIAREDWALSPGAAVIGNLIEKLRQITPPV